MRQICAFLSALCLLVAAPAALANDGPPTPGVSLKVYHLETAYEAMPDMAPGQLPNLHEIRETIDYPNRTAFGNRQRHFYAEVDAIVRVQESGSYTFRLISDDGSLLFIDEELVINHDGLHGAEPKDGAVELSSGDHALKIRFFQARQDTALRLEWKAPGDNDFSLVPADKLFNNVGEERPTAGGNKRVLVRGVREARPGAGESLNSVHPSFTLEQARPDDFQPRVGALCFLPNGMLAVTSFPPQNNGILREEFNGSLYVLGNLDAEDPNDITVTEITDELHDPLGMNYVDGALYICDREEISKWTDEDGDGIPETRESFASGWISDNYHHFTFGLPYYDGHFYVTLSTNITFNRHIDAEGFDRNFPLPVALNGPNQEMRGCLLKISMEDPTDIQIVSGGLRTPNGTSLGPGGVILVPDNQGAWKPASGIYACEQGAFYGHYNDTESRSEFYPDGGVPSAFSTNADGSRIPIEEIDPPAVWVPQNECANSPGEMIEIREGVQHAGQYLMAEITRGGIRRVFLEEINGTWQGAIFRHSHGFEAGTNRLEWGPDGALYVGCMGGAGNWTWRGTTFGLQRMVPTEETAFEFATIEATANGFRVTFTEPVPKEQLENLDSWAINAWTYLHTPQYGGPKREQHQANPTAAVASDDRMSVELTVPDRRPNYVYHIRIDPTSDAGNTMWSPEAWYTFHEAPAE